MKIKILCNWKYIIGFLGGLIIFLLPPFQSPDEFNHFFRAWQISQGDFLAQRRETMTGVRVGGLLPEMLLTLAKPYQRLPFNKNAKINKDTLLFSWNKIQYTENQIFIDFVNTAIYSPTAYLPQSTAIFFGKTLQLPPLSIFWLSRFMTFLIWFLLIGAALRCLRPLPEFYEIVLFLTLLPSSLLINATASADVLTNGLSFWLMAFFFRKMMLNENFIHKEIVYVLLASCIISVNKIAYFPLLLSFGLLPNNIFLKSYFTKYSFMFILLSLNLSSILYWLWLCKTQGLMVRFEEYDPNFRVGQQINEGVDAVKQLYFILENPFQFFKIFFYSIFKTLPHTLIHYVGKFGWEKNYLAFPIITLLWVGILLQSCCAAQITPLSNQQIRIIWGIGSLAILSMTIIMYLIWSPVGAPFIENLGGKYFIPIFPYFFMCFTPIGFFRKCLSFLKKYKLKNLLLRGGLLIAWLATIREIWTRYYE